MMVCLTHVRLSADTGVYMTILAASDTAAVAPVVRYHFRRRSRSRAIEQTQLASRRKSNANDADERTVPVRHSPEATIEGEPAR